MNGKKMEITLTRPEFISYAVTRDCLNSIKRLGDVEEEFEIGRIKQGVIMYIKTALNPADVRVVLNDFKVRRKLNYHLSVKSI